MFMLVYGDVTNTIGLTRFGFNAQLHSYFECGVVFHSRHGFRPERLNLTIKAIRSKVLNIRISMITFQHVRITVKDDR